MITKEQAIEAIETIEDYLKQLKSEVYNSEPNYRDLQYVRKNDEVECVKVHGSSTKHNTKGDRYTVLKTESYRFQILCDSGKKKWYYMTTEHFKLI